MKHGSDIKKEAGVMVNTASLTVHDLDEIFGTWKKDGGQCTKTNHFLSKAPTQFIPIILSVLLGHLLLFYMAKVTIEKPQIADGTPQIHAKLYYVKKQKQQQPLVQVSESAVPAEPLPNPEVVPVKPITNKKVKTELEVSHRIPPVEQAKSAPTSLAEKTLQGLASQIVEQAKNDAATINYQEFIDKKSQIARSITPYVEGLAVGELKVKTKPVNCDNALNKSVAVFIPIEINI
ncbi:hypothetical protein [Thalassotalea marina]|nr:hypothetical protein [Thalassotalea marina]